MEGNAPETPAAAAPVSPSALPTSKAVKLDIGFGCEYEGEVMEMDMAKFKQREPLDSLFKEIDLRMEYRYRMLEAVQYLRNPWFSCEPIAPANPEVFRTVGDVVTFAQGKGVVRATNGTVLYDGEVRTKTHFNLQTELLMGCFCVAYSYVFLFRYVIMSVDERLPEWPR